MFEHMDARTWEICEQEHQVSLRRIGMWPGLIIGWVLCATFSTPLLAQMTLPGPGIINTVAGDGFYGYTGDGGPATSAQLSHPTGVAVDAAGNIYFADHDYCVIRKVTASTGVISTVAGNGTYGYSGDGGPATGAELASPQGIAVDSAGNIYIADTGNDVIRKVTAASGIISTVAGNSRWAYSGDGGAATSASLNVPVDVRLDSAGNLYIADQNNDVVRKVSSATGIITTVAGTGTGGYLGDGGPATGAELDYPDGIAVDPAGDLYIADSGNNVVREIAASSGTITTIAGNGSAGYSGDGGPATSAELDGPGGVALDGDGNLYIVDGNPVIRQVSASTGKIATVAGNGTAGYSGDGGPATSAEVSEPYFVAVDSTGNFYISDYASDCIRAVGSNVTVPVVTTPSINWTAPSPVTYGTALGSTQLNATASVPGTFTYEPGPGAVLTAGLQSLTVAFTPNDTAQYGIAMATVALTVTQATPIVTWATPASIVYGAALNSTQLNATANVAGTFSYNPPIGTILTPGQQTLSLTFTPADSTDYTTVTAIVTLTVTTQPTAGIITTIAGDGYSGYTGDGGPAVGASMGKTADVAVDSAGNVYIADSYEMVIRKVSAATGIITTVAGNGTQGYAGDGGLATSAELNTPEGVAVDAGGNLYIADSNNSRIRMVAASTGIISTVAGNGTPGLSGDGGLATNAELNWANGVAVDSAGDIYIADSENHSVREVAASSGIINTIAGNSVAGYSGDGGPATSAELNLPVSVAVDAHGNVYILDTGANVVREVSASSGTIATVAGNGTAGYSGDGGPAISAEFNAYHGIAVDGAGNLYISDSFNNVIRMVAASTGLISTVAGNGAAGYSGDGGPATSAEMNCPDGVAVDSAGNLYIADNYNLRIRAVGSLASLPVVVSVTPATATLYAAQTQQFAASVTNTSNTSVTWSASPAGVGTISSTGLYTAPAAVSMQQTVMLTATSQANSAATSTATVTLMPRPVVSVSPPEATLYVGQVQQFTASVTNASSTAVSWSISPSGYGTIDAAGVYVAPADVTSQQTVTVTATSIADSAGTGSATITLAPVCVSNGYSYERAVVIDHTKVPNTDQTNFPLLFSITDPAFASTTNGGHVTSSSGFDIIFSSDPNGQNKLDYEMEEYNPVTGQVIAWVRMPTISHSTDTVFYVFYGNPSITTSQQNPTGVWDANYKGVWHVPNGSVLSLADSTSNGNNATDDGAVATAGEIDGGMQTNGSTYATIGTPSSLANLAQGNVTFSAWVNTASGSGGKLMGKDDDDDNTGWSIGVTSSNNIDFAAIYSISDLRLMSTVPVGNGTWSYVVVTMQGGVSPAEATVYVNGQPAGTTTGGTGYRLDDSPQIAYLANSTYGDDESAPLKGSADEFRISTTIRSADWIATEYNNQSSPSTFYAIYPENSGTIAVPQTVDLYGGQIQQFNLTGVCNPGTIVWSMPDGSPGTLTSTGLYTSPATIDSPQTVTLTATTLGAASQSYSAQVNLLPPLAITVDPSSATLNESQTQQFTATVANAIDSGVTWSISPSGAGTVSQTGLYTAPSTISAAQTVTITATSEQDPSQSAAVDVVLQPPTPTLPVQISLTPSGATLYGGQTQQFTATVANTTNTGVTWTSEPSGVGSISSSGLYTAPASTSSQQTVDIIATSQANTAESALAVISLSPGGCQASGYAYERAITIDHTKVANSDQDNFPFLFSTTDPTFATTTNGGHVTSPDGYDIIFSSDPSGTTKLDHEIEEYNPGTGQLVAWVRIPDLSHTSDTTIYMFYGNPAVTTSQQNVVGVWDAYYKGVWHLPNGTTLSANDSTANGNNGTLIESPTATSGQIDGAAAFNGSDQAIDVGNSASLDVDGTFTISAWIYPTNGTARNGIFSTRSTNAAGSWQLEEGNSDGYNNSISVTGVDTYMASTGTNSVTLNAWNYVVAVKSAGSAPTIYVNGVEQPLAVSTPSYSVSDNTADKYIGEGTSANQFFPGSLDEVRFSATDRSADWIATDYNNQSSPSTFYTLSAENPSQIVPAAVTLFPGQSQQFEAASSCGSSISWSLPEGDQGTLTATGLYTAPASIPAEETVTVTATSQANPTNPFTATVTLLPAITVSVSPASSTLTANQTQQFTASVADASNSGVAWSVTPAGVGTMSPDGIYQAPSSISTQQTLTITATSQEDPTKSASAMLTLSPTQCASTGYGYEREIVIDHTKVPNTDQKNFPFLFNTTDPDFATTANGGHVTSTDGYDIMFSTDPGGATKLDFEIEQYNPVTGQLVAWIRIPTLSHSSDTILYVFYGNPTITTAQQNPAGVWDSSYQAVYHMAGLAAGTASDSTSNDNSGTVTGVSDGLGQIDGAATFNGTSGYAQIPAADFPSYPTGTYSNLGISSDNQTSPFTATFGVWFMTATSGGILGQTPSLFCTNFFFECIGYSPTVPGDYDPSGWSSMLYVDDNGNLDASDGPSSSILSSPKAYNDSQWHFAVVTYANDGTETLYVDGQSVASEQQQIAVGYSSAYAYFLGTAYTLLDPQGNSNWLYFNGNLDEVTISNVARSSDWIQTEYNNQASPSTFYTLYSAGTVGVTPPSISLYASQTQQFTVTGMCGTSVEWTMPSGSSGTLTSDGFYTAPAAISSQQAITINAVNQASDSPLGSAVVTLLPQPNPITLSAAAQSPYPVGTSESFEVVLLDSSGTPVSGIPVTFNVSGANSSIGTETTDNNGTATFAYSGANSGNDTVEASAIVGGEQETSNAVNASWVLPAANSSGSVSVAGPPALGRGGLIGAFTNGSGAVIEPVAIGAEPREFAVPAGATQLQLGINDSYFPDNGGTGFVVSVNGNQVTIPPTAMPWQWTAGGLNNAYQFGLNDGTAPVIAASGLVSGQIVTVDYQSGSVSADFPLRPATNADGDPTSITGATSFEGAFTPTLYTTASSYPTGQPIPLEAVVTNGSGMPAANVPVTLSVAGANPGQYEATTDSTGAAVFTYTGAYVGVDTLGAQAVISQSTTLDSNQTGIGWASYAAPLPAASLELKLFGSVNTEQEFIVVATDSSGNPIPNLDVGFYVYGADNFQTDATTDSSGQASLGYYHVNSGTYNVVAVESQNRDVVFSGVYTNVWSPSNSGSSGGNSDTISVSISGQTAVAMPGSLTLTGTVTDTVGTSPALVWSQVSGPGIATFATPQQATTTVSFSDPGTYVLQLTASDSGDSSSSQFTVTVTPIPVSASDQGPVGSPLNGSTVTGLVPITLATGVTLQSGTLVYYPANNINDVVTLNADTTGTGRIGVLDTTMLPNQSYWVQLSATDTSGNSQNGLILVTAAGNYKPGRVTASVTDLVVPANGLSIQIQRIFDSLNAGTVGDFGYGWSLSTAVNLTIDPKGDVTLTLGGQRRTFYLTPQMPSCTAAGCLFPYYFVQYTAEPGFYGTLTEASPSCPLGIVVPDGSTWYCYGGGLYNPSAFIYADATGTQYLISANGNLQSITDKNGNSLTITPNGITSSTGLNVPFVRDSQGRITQITDPQGNQYLYSYDDNGNLASVTYPNTSQPSTYTYNANHYYTGGTDFRSNPLPTTSYYGSTDTDPNGLPLNGRLESTTDALGETTSYAYNLATNTTIVTYPPDSTGATGTATMVYDSYGDLLNSTDPLGHTTTSVYDSNHDLISVTDPLGHATTYTYDQNGNQTSVTYPATATSTNTTSTTIYNQYSEPISTTDELGNVRTFNYDANYNPQSVTDSLGSLATFQFNPNGTMAAGAIGFDIAQQPQMASQFTYDANGNLASRTDALGRTTSYTYNNLGQKLTMTIPLPNSSTSAAAATTTYSYDPLGDLTQTAAPLGRTTSSTYDGNGNKLTDTDANGNVTNYAYDALNRLTLTKYPDGSTVSNTYDFRNNVVDSIDQDGHDTHNTYDLSGRLVSVTKAYGTSSASTSSYTYDNAGRKLTMTDSLGNTTSYAYDNAGNLLSVSGPGGTFQYAYDNARNQISITDGNNHTTQYQYDARKRQTVTTYPDGTTTTNAYDGPGNLAGVTDQAGNQVQYTYDAANQLHTVVQLASPNTGNNSNTYGYDNDGNLITLSDENGHTTQDAFNLLYEQTSKTLPDGTLTETRTYDNNGNLATVTHFNGVTTTYTYDSLNRLLSRSTPGEATVSNTYTSTGKFATTTDASGTTTYTYDTMDRLTAKATPEGTLSYTYDADGHVLSIASSNANGASTSYTYDNLNRLSTVTDGRTGGVTAYSYDTANNLVTAAYPNGVQSTFQYDQENRLTSMTAGNAAYGYTLGPTGIKTGATELSGRAVAWGFDGMYRLTSETVSNDPSKENGSVSYTLDPVGNRLQQISSLHNIGSVAFSYGPDDTILSESYDPDGNTTASGGKTFAYNSQNQLMSMNGGAVSLVYDGYGNRVAKTVSGVTTTYLVEDDVNPTGYPQVFDELTNGVVTRTYTYGLQRISEDQIVNNTWTPSFYGYDGFGTVRQLTNAAGTVTDSYEYDAFGNELNSTGSTPNEMLYRGEQYDSDLGLYYLRARWYNPATGRFMSRDPNEGQSIIPATLHKYLYAAGDPINRVDPSGKDDYEEYDFLSSRSEEVLSEPEEDDCAAYEAYWELLTQRAPEQSYPYAIVNVYNELGEILSWTTYDEFGNRAYQYEIAPGTRHGPGYHFFDQCGNMGFGKGPRSPHIPF